MDRLGRKRLPPASNRDHVRRLEQENREIDELLENIRSTDKEGEKEWPG